MNKKGSLSDAFSLAVQFVGVILLAVIVMYVFGLIFTNMASATTDQVAKSILNKWSVGFPKWIDSFMFFLYIGLLLSSVILALFIQYNPIMLFISVLLFIIGALYGIIAHLVLEAVYNAIPSLFTNAPLLTFLLNNYVAVNILAMALILIAMFWNPIGNSVMGQLGY